MNFLAHLHLAQACQSSPLGNLLGDFVKGDPQGRYPEPVVQGIRLHRFVDAYTDRHPLVLQLKSCFPAESRRFAPIGLDLFWDHCLARDWHERHDHPLDRFCQTVYGQIEQELTFTPPESFMQVHQRMWQGRWLESYAEFENIEFALQRMSRRSPRMQALTSCIPSLKTHYQHLSENFTQFYPQVLEAVSVASSAMASGNESLHE
ncbi:Acyl carrier protein phosphodiesterase [Vibrio ruber DSM 16370]|uniref:Acyl carrier protein phosphodiesterase n=1 Tax=Vibrio ruber (strain DSM 16370 / JCM 11486 / BCRC 17186 / CECT 7878 / LMG 23124 / VR1) TaxID=1123498 RepID=A0A1R4LQF8_VIBR1|nr:ACP phosphodiesterase [Vibrio ruber]SJN58841.1 Acyl carrier protein phosphodiesterase [Vibrio ruber DSM 16370]